MAVIKKNGGYMALPISIKRGNPIPLDDSSIWYSLEEMQAYATFNPVAYVGQILSLVDETNETAKAYVILDTSGTLQEIGSAAQVTINTDNKTIVLKDNNLMLKDFGIKYYRYVPATETEESTYILQEVTEEYPWKVGLEPRVASVDGELTLAWYEPNPQTEAGINSQLSSLQTAVGDLTTVVTNHTTLLGTAAGDTTPGTGIIGSLEDLNKKAVQAVKIGDAVLVPNTAHQIELPIYDGSSFGVVQKPTGSLENAEDYFLNAVGNWAIPVDSRIGNLTYNEIKYNTVEDYVAAVSADLLQWEELE